MKRKKRENLLNELLEWEEKEIDNVKRKELSFMMDDLLEKIEGVIDFIVYEFDEVERDEKDMKECLKTLCYMNYILYGLQLMRKLKKK